MGVAADWPAEQLVADYSTSIRTHWHMRPRAMARVRVTRHSSYTTRECLEAQAQVVLMTSRFRGTFPKGTYVGIGLRFDCVRHPWRGDMDNLEKLVMDALRAQRLGKLRDGTVLDGAGVYADDRQVRRKLTVLGTVATPAEEGVWLHMYKLVPTEEDTA